MSALITAVVLLAFMGARARAVQDSVLPDIPVTVGVAVSNMGTQGPNGVPICSASKTFTFPPLPVWGFLAKSRAVHPDSLIPLQTDHYKSETMIFFTKSRAEMERDPVLSAAARTGSFGNREADRLLPDLTRHALLLLERVSADSAAVVAEIRLVGEQYAAVKPSPEFPRRLKVRIQGGELAPPGKR